MPRPQVIAHHLIWTLYGHWLPNDLRGSGSAEIRQEKFSELGPIHQGRKPELMQPTRDELRRFQRQAEPFGQIVCEQNYTVWACAILKNHIHVVIRKHRDEALTMWHKFADASRERVIERLGLPDDHRVWASRPYKVFLRTPEEVWLWGVQFVAPSASWFVPAFVPRGGLGNARLRWD